MNTKTFGLIESQIEDNHYLLGDGVLPTDVLQMAGHGWAPFLPPNEVQNKNGLETENCTAYGTLHAIATLGNRKFGASFQKNLSERYMGIMAGTTINGNNPHKVAETIRRTAGVIPDIYLPFDDTIRSWADYYSPNPIQYKLFATGAHWLKKYTFGHEWVYLAGDPIPVKKTKMKYALQYSTLAAAVYAWSQHADGLYYSDDTFKNHWVTIYDYDEGKSWSAFDSYDNTHKLLDWNFDFGQCKRYHLDYNMGGELMGSIPEPVYAPYALYVGLNYLKQIIA